MAELKRGLVYHGPVRICKEEGGYCAPSVNLDIETLDGQCDLGNILLERAEVEDGQATLEGNVWVIVR